MSEGFWGKVDIRSPEECWPWVAGLDSGGYGNFWLDGQCHKAHRVCFFLTYDRWPEPCGLHSCDNRRCCNPGHIFEGTKAVNNTDRHTKGRDGSHKGNSNGRAMISTQDVLDIRREHPRGVVARTKTAQRYGVSYATIKDILSGRSWSHL